MSEERLDGETERLIEDFGDEACVKGQIFMQAFGSRAERLVENKSAIQRTTAARIALRERIRTLVEEAREEGREATLGRIEQGKYWEQHGNR